MGGGKWLGLGLALAFAAGPAWGQSEDELMAAVGHQITVYAVCLKQHAHDLAKLDGSENAIVGRAFAACGGERQDLLDHLQMAPLNAATTEAADAVQQLDDALRPKMIETVKLARRI